MRLLIYLSILCLFACGGPGEPVAYQQDRDTARVGMHTMNGILNRASQVRAAALNVKPGSFDTIAVSELTGSRLRMISQNLELLEERTVTEGTILAYVRDSLRLQDSLFFVDNGSSIVPVGLQDTINISGTIVVTDSVQFLVDSITAHRTEINALHDSITALRTDIGSQSIDTLWFYDNGSTISVVAQGDTIMIVGSETAGVGNTITVPTYDSLRNYSGTATAVIITDSRYGGLFYEDATAGENGGTEIGGNWRRVLDGNTYQPEWWEIGGHDQSGTDGGIKNECDALIACSSVADTGSTISLRKNKTYLIDRSITIKPNQYWRGNGATLKRFDTPITALTNAESIGSSVWEVDDTTGFRVGHRVLILDESDPNGGRAFDENCGIGNNYTITAVGASSITVSNNLDVGMSSGDSVIVVPVMFNQLSGEDYNNIIFEHIDFDGNRAGNPYTVDWRFNWTMSLQTGKNLTIRNCNFFNTPAENITFGSGVVENCDFRNLNGSGVHISSDSTFLGIKIFNSKFENVNEVGNALMNHSEGAITFSANTQDVRVIGCSFKTGGAAVLGISGQDDYKVFVSNCFAQDFISIFTQTTSTTAARYSYFHFENNVFDNCGDVQMQGNQAEAGNSVNRVKFINNTFVNGRLYARDITQSKFDGNEWFYDTTGFTAWSSAITGQNAYIQFLDFDQITFTNNTVVGPLTNNSNTKNGVLFQHNNQRRRNSGGTLTNYLYPQRIRISGNVVANFTAGIVTYPASATGQSPTYQAVGWEISNNQVYVTQDVISASETIGINCDLGVLCSNNMVYMPGSGTNSSSAGIVGYGPNVTTSTLSGATLIGNIVFGPTGSSFKGIKVGNSSNAYNKKVIVVNNFSTDPVYGVLTGSIVENNYTLDSLGAWTAPSTPEVGDWEQYKDQY